MAAKTTDVGSLTIAQIRRALREGNPDATLVEALATIDQHDTATTQHEQRNAAYNEFVNARAACRAEAVNAAADDAIEDVERTAAREQLGAATRFRRLTPGITAASPGRRHAAAQEAAREAGEAFDRRWPALGRDEWESAGSPAEFERNAVQRAADALKGAIAA